MVNAQEYINKNYPTKEKREEVKKLNIWNSNLEDDLDLSDFVNLEWLSCCRNKLTNLKLTGLKNLYYLDARENKFTNLDDIISLENPEKLKECHLSDNNFPEQDLSKFSKFINLEKLWIANYHYETKNNIYNRFTGSLEPLKNMSNLKELDIGWTNIDSGLEYLPKSLVNFWCYGDLWNGYGTPENKSKKFNEELKDFRSGNKGNHDLTAYWLTNPRVLLNKEYPKDGVCNGEFDPKNKGKKREEIIELNLTNRGLRGELKLEGFSNLEILECDKNELNSLDISMCSKLKVINCGRNKLTSLDCSNNKMLTTLCCWVNELTNLNISNCSDLKKLGCSSNQLTNLDLNNNLKLKSLDIADNKFPKQDLGFLSHLINLETLGLGNSGERKDDLNHFEGDLSPLVNMEKLKWLSFNNTEMEDNSNKVLPNVTKVNFSFSYRPNAYEFIDLHKHISGAGFSNIFSPINTTRIMKLFSEEVGDYKLEVAKVMESASELNENKTKEELENKITELETKLTESENNNKQIQHDLTRLEQKLTSEQEQRTIAEDNFANEKEHNQLLQETNKILVQKISLEEDRRKLEAQLKEKNGDREISEIRRRLKDTEEKLVKSKNELGSKQAEIDKMAKQIEENRQKEKESAPIKKLEEKSKELESSFKHLENYQNEENQLTNSIPRSIIGKIAGLYPNNKINISNLGAMSRGVNYVGGGLSTYGLAEIGGGLTLFGSTVDSIVSGIESLDKQKQEELIKLEGTCQELKKIYKNFSKGLVLPKKMDETISDFLELINELQEGINSEVNQEEINKKFEELKEKGQEVEKDLKKVIKSLEVKTDSSQQTEIYMGGIEQEQQTKASSSEINQESEDNKQTDLQAVIIQDERTPLLFNKK